MVKKGKSNMTDKQAKAAELKVQKKYKLTDMQKAFADYFIFVTGLDAIAAVKMAGYAHGVPENKYSDDLFEYYKRMNYGKIAKGLINNPKILHYIKDVREDLDNQLVVDKLWVINKLKALAGEDKPENIQLKATELIGKTMEMFTDRNKNVEGIDDPAKIAEEAFQRRKNVVKFDKQGNE